MTRVIAVTAGKALSADQLSMLSARGRNVLTTGDCPVYKLFLRRTLAILRHTLVEGGVSEDRFVEALRKVGINFVWPCVVYFICRCCPTELISLACT